VASSRRLGVSVKSILLRAYIELIEGELGIPSPTIGIVSNCRSGRLSDPFGAIGLFWNMVPVSLRGLSENRDEGVRMAQQALLDLEPHALYPLQQIAADRDADELFFATFNFVDFPNSARVDGVSGLKLLGGMDLDRFHYPLNYAFAVLRETGQIAVRTEYDPEFFTAERVSSMNAALAEIVIRSGTAIKSE
jgi:hypothetical protein